LQTAPRKLGKDITAFIGVSINHPKLISHFEKEIDRVEDVQECHHVTGEHTLLLKVKADDTSALEELIRKIRSIEGVARTETSVVLSTHTEGLWIALNQKTTVADSRHRHEETIVPLKHKRGG
jgi:Lrp/AsnC family leucine-responsive transcriptional regulator